MLSTRIASHLEAVTRYDIGAFLAAPEETPEGFLKITGYASRAGIFEYLNPDGSIRRELRLPEEVGNVDSLASYEGKPITIRHPGGLVTPANSKRFSSGTVLRPAVMDGDMIAFKGIVTDENAIAMIKSGRLRQLSSGYRLVLDRRPGVHPLWGNYDAIQRKVDINHLALVEEGRAGPMCAVKMDAAQLAAALSTWRVGVRSSVSVPLRFDAGAAVQCMPPGRPGMSGVYEKAKKDAELNAKKRNALATSSFAVPGSRALPIHDPEHVRAAMARFGQTTFATGEKRAAFNRVVARAKELGIDPAHFIKEWGNRLDDLNPRGAMADDKNKPKPGAKPAPRENGLLEVAVAETAKEKERADAAESKLASETARADAAEGKVAGLEQQVADLESTNIDQARVDELSTKIEALELENADLQNQLATANDPKRIDTAVKGRLEIERIALVLLDEGTNIDGLSDRDVMILVIEKRGGTVKQEDSIDHVRGQFDTLVRGWRKNADAMARLRTLTGGLNKDGQASAPKNARDAYVERQQNSWKPAGAAGGKGA